MKFILLLITIYICIVIFQISYIYYLSKIENINEEKKIKFNRQNERKLIDFFKKNINERLNLLYSKKLSYDDWLIYNREKVLVNYENEYKYYFFVFELLPRNRSVQKVTANDKLVNRSFNDVLKVNNEKLLYTKFTTDKKLIQSFYNSSRENEFSEVKYYWLDPITNKSVLKKSIVKRWTDKTTGKVGVIGIGLDLEYLDKNNTFDYYEEIGYVTPINISLLTLVLSIIIYKLRGEGNTGFKALFLLLITNIYLTVFLTKKENYASSDMENKKEADINSGLLSASFLAGISIFILNTFQKSLKIDLFTESAFIFGVSLILLLIATLRETDFLSTNDIIWTRITTQLIFNFALILNTFIILNYLIYILTAKLNKIKWSNYDE